MMFLEGAAHSTSNCHKCLRKNKQDQGRDTEMQPWTEVLMWEGRTGSTSNAGGDKGKKK